MKLDVLARVLLGGAVALALTACANEAGQQPMIIAATAVQTAPAETLTETPIETSAESAVESSPATDNAASGTITPATDAAAAPAEAAAAEATSGEVATAVATGAPANESAAEPVLAPAPAISAEPAPVEIAAAEPAEEKEPISADAVPVETTVAADAGRAAGAPAAETTAEPEAPAVTVALAPATPSAFVDSYRLAAHFKIVASGADGIVQETEITAEGAWKRAEHAFGYDASFWLESSDNGAAQTLEYVMLGDHVALRTGDGWTTSPRGEELPIREPVAMLDVPFIGALSLGAQVGEEEVAGVPTVHYRVDNADEFGALVADAFGGRAGTLTTITLDSWLAPDGYVVKYLLAATTTGATAQGSDGVDRSVDQTIDVSYAMSDIDAVGEIAWPAEAPPATALIVPGFDADAFPLPEDAALQPSVGSLLFTTALDELAVRDFYAEQLGAQGWSLEGDYGYYTARREDRALVIAITAGEDEQPTRVEVFAEPSD